MRHALRALPTLLLGNPAHATKPSALLIYPPQQWRVFGGGHKFAYDGGEKMRLSHWGICMKKIITAAIITLLAASTAAFSQISVSPSEAESRPENMAVGPDGTHEEQLLEAAQTLPIGGQRLELGQPVNISQKQLVLTLDFHPTILPISPQNHDQQSPLSQDLPIFPWFEN